MKTATPMYIDSRHPDASKSPLLHPALSTSLSRSFGLNSPFSLSAISSSLTAVSNSPSLSSMSMSLGRSFEERPKLEAQFFRNFSCCGLDLQDLHGLLEHFEECHVAFDEENPTEHDVDMGNEDGSEGTISGPPSPRTMGLHNPHPLSVEHGMDIDMELDDFDSLPTSMSSFTHTSHSTYEATSNITNAPQQKKFASAMNLNMPMNMQSMFPHSFTTDETVQSSVTSLPNPLAQDGNGLFVQPTNNSHILSQHNSQMGLPPSLLFANPQKPLDGSELLPDISENMEMDSDAFAQLLDGTEGQPSPESDDSSGPSNSDLESTFASSTLGIGMSGGDKPLAHPALATISAMHPLGTGVQISPSGRPYTPPSEKPFKCSVPGCDKSYKQQNGLKYHRLHGHCNQNAGSDDGRGEGKPYVCHIPSCGKRYKNMNGLRYHYQHSGAHGALGLQMLAAGTHPTPQFPPGHRSRNSLSRGTSPARSNVTSRSSSPFGMRIGLN